MDVWRERSLRATIVLIAVSVYLIGPSLVAIGASLPLYIGLIALGIAFGLARSWLADLPTVIGHDLGTYGQDAWLGPFLAVVLIFVVAPSASPAELQTLGGLAGLVGMVNYFVRPLYFGLIGLVRSRVGGSNSSQPSQ